ncbi:MAG TPA: hypothetical protein VFE24_05515 [Pirellulales bacterium]|jgi:hypothetical protein|nr:hypothetical protein [Pirellulales bacterium]
METLLRQVRQIERKLFLERWLRAAAACCAASLIVGLIAVAIPKLWPISWHGGLWQAVWLGGAVGLGLLTAGIYAWVRRASRLAVAVEIDRRCGLKERVSSSLALAPDERETAAAAALVADTLRRIERVDVGQQFRFQPRREFLFPILPAVLAAIVLLIPDREQDTKAKSVTSAKANQEIQTSSEALRKKIAEQKQLATELGLKDAEETFAKIENGAREIGKNSADKKQALLKFNDLAKQIEQRQQKLGGPDSLREQLKKLQNLEQGPADKAVQAIQKGDFAKAQEELAKLAEQLKNGEQSPETKEKLAKQLGDLQQKMQDLAAAQEQSRQQLQHEMQQQQRDGNLAAADQLQQQLDKLNRDAGQSQQLQNLAQGLGEAVKHLKQGNPAQARSALDQLQQQLSQLEKQQQECKMLEGALDQISDAKSQISPGDGPSPGGGKEAAGGADQHGEPVSGGGVGGSQPGNAHDPNFAKGAQPDDKKFHVIDKKMDLPVGKGPGVVDDLVNGPNLKGRVHEQIEAQVEGFKKDSPDPLTSQRLSRKSREHAQQYFDALREGK